MLLLLLPCVRDGNGWTWVGDLAAAMGGGCIGTGVRRSGPDFAVDLSRVCIDRCSEMTLIPRGGNTM